MSAENINHMITYSKNGILSKVISKKGADVTLFCMAKGTEISEHMSTKQGFVYVIEGKGVFVLEGKNIQMLPGVLIHISNNAVHALKAEEDTSFLLFLF